MKYSPKSRLAILLFFVCVPMIFGNEDAVGVYVLDAEAIEESAMNEVRAEFEKSMKGKDEQVRQQMEQQWTQMKGQVKTMLKTMTIQLEVKKDGTFFVKGQADVNEMSASGTWEWKDGKLLMTVTESDGKREEKPETVPATLENGVLRMKPDKNVPFEFIMIKQKS